MTLLERSEILKFPFKNSFKPYRKTRNVPNFLEYLFHNVTIDSNLFEYWQVSSRAL